MSYPVRSYRSGQRTALAPAPGGFQSPGQVPQRPANDNYPGSSRPRPRIPTPANDNAKTLYSFKRRSRPLVRGVLTFGRTAQRVGPFGRFNQLIEAGKLAYDLSTWVQTPSSVMVANPPAGWTQNNFCCADTPNGYSSQVLWTTCGSNPCAVRVGGNSSVDFVADGASAVGAIYRLPERYINGNQEYRRSFVWRRVTGTAPFVMSRWMPFPISVMNPMWDPFSLPVNAPGPRPYPLPWKMIPMRQPNPFYSPSEQTQFGPSPIRGLSYRPNPGPDAVAISPGKKPVPGPSHTSTPPPRNTREKKGRMKKGMAVLLKGAYTASEAYDAIEAIWKALPAKHRTKDASGIQMLDDIWNNLGELDLDKAVLNLIANHFIDLVVGRSSAKADEFFKQTGASGWSNWL